MKGPAGYTDIVDFHFQNKGAPQLIHQRSGIPKPTGKLINSNPDSLINTGAVPQNYVTANV